MRMLAGVGIEELPIPFTAVATDLTNSREVWFQRGAVATAIRASIGIPKADARHLDSLQSFITTVNGQLFARCIADHH